MNAYPYIAMLVAAILVSLATCRLHSGVRSISSLLLCFFAPLAVIYPPFSLWLFGQAMNHWPSWMSNRILWIAVDMLPATFVLIASGLFFLSIRQQDWPDRSLRLTPSARLDSSARH